MHPESFISGGLLGDIDFEVAKARWIEFDYDGKAANSVLALQWRGYVLDASGNRVGYDKDDPESGLEHFEWSAGSKSLSQFIPNDATEGRTLIRTENSTQLGLMKGSNAVVLLDSAKLRGFPEDKLRAGDASAFDSLICHIIREKAPERIGIEKTEAQKAKKFEDTIAVVSAIHRLPGDKKAFRGAKAAGPVAAPKPAVTPGAAASTVATPAAATGSTAGVGAEDSNANPSAAAALAALKAVFPNLPAPSYSASKKALFLSMKGVDNAVRSGAVVFFDDVDWMAQNGYLVVNDTLQAI